MTNIKFAIQNNQIALLNHVNLIAGTRGQKCQFFFDDTWKTLNKTISYKVEDTVLRSEPLIGTEATIPPEILANAGLQVEISLTGVLVDNQTTFEVNNTFTQTSSNNYIITDDSIIIPTTWCPIGVVLPSSYSYVFNSNNEVIYDGGVIL